MWDYDTRRLLAERLAAMRDEVDELATGLDECIAALVRIEEDVLVTEWHELGQRVESLRFGWRIGHRMLPAPSSGLVLREVAGELVQ